MSTRSLSVQEETGVLQNVEETASDPGPALSGPAPALWTGFAAFVVIFIVVLLLIIRGRVLRPAARRAAARTDFFEPAGDNAEITFEDEESAAAETVPPVKQENPARAHDAGSLQIEETPPLGMPEEETASPAEKPKRRAPFAGLFSKKPKAKAAETAPDDSAFLREEDEGALFPADAEPSSPPEPAPAHTSEKPQTDDHASLPAQLKVMRDDIEARRREAEENELRRLEAAEEAEEEARRRRRIEQYAAAPPPPETPIQTAPSPPTAAHENLAALKSELENAFTDRLENLSRDMGARLDALADKTATAQSEAETRTVSEAHFAEFADLLGEQMHALRESSASSIAALSDRIDRLDTNAESLAALSKRLDALNEPMGAAPAATLSGRVQLTEVLTSVLPASRFTLKSNLSTGKTVDALVTTAGGSAPVAIDARFPVEAFEEYQRRRNTPDEASAETTLRRAVLRHLVDIAEKQIIEGETAGAAMMFAPSEQILTTLHAVFADLVQESYRARVWIVSPTTLAATLHTISALAAAPASAPADTHIGAVTTLPEANGEAEQNEEASPQHTEHRQTVAGDVENNAQEDAERPVFPLR